MRFERTRCAICTLGHQGTFGHLALPVIGCDFRGTVACYDVPTVGSELEEQGQYEVAQVDVFGLPVGWQSHEGA